MSILESIVCEFSRAAITVDKLYHFNKDCHILSSMNCVVSGGQESVNAIFYRLRVVKSVDISLWLRQRSPLPLILKTGPDTYPNVRKKQENLTKVMKYVKRHLTVISIHWGLKKSFLKSTCRHLVYYANWSFPKSKNRCWIYVATPNTS